MNPHHHAEGTDYLCPECSGQFVLTYAARDMFYCPHCHGQFSSKFLEHPPYVENKVPELSLLEALEVYLERAKCG